MNEFLKTTDGKRVLKFALTAIALLVAFLALETATLVKDLNAPSPAFNTISVSGSGEATSTPDIAVFSFSVSADGKVVSDTQATVTEKTNAILDGLKALGIEDKDIRTADYSVYPKYVYQQTVCTVNSCPPSRQIPDGYTVSHSVTVKVRKVEDAGKALSLVGDKGATNISGLSFTLDNPNAPSDLAHLRAVDDARNKAEALADRLGVKLGRVISYYDNAQSGGAYPVSAVYDKAAGGMGGVAPVPTIPTGENTVSASVSVTYEIR